MAEPLNALENPDDGGNWSWRVRRQHIKCEYNQREMSYGADELLFEEVLINNDWKLKPGYNKKAKTKSLIYAVCHAVT